MNKKEGGIMPKFVFNIDESAFNDVYVQNGNLTDYSSRFECYFGS